MTVDTPGCSEELIRRERRLCQRTYVRHSYCSAASQVRLLHQPATTPEARSRMQRPPRGIHFPSTTFGCGAHRHYLRLSRDRALALTGVVLHPPANLARAHVSRSSPSSMANRALDCSGEGNHHLSTYVCVDRFGRAVRQTGWSSIRNKPVTPSPARRKLNGRKLARCRSRHNPRAAITTTQTYL